MASRNIDIITSQNVVITYELASVGNRLMASGIDALVVYTGSFVWLQLQDSLDLQGQFFIESILLLWLYHLLFAIFFRGQTLGMRAIGIKPMKPGGGNVAFSDLFLRWVTRPLDITLSFGALAIFLMLGSEKRQRLGDMLAGTVIVHKKHSIHFGLNDILSFHQGTAQENIRYPEVRHMKESDMLLIKNLLHNQAGYGHRVHLSAMEACRDKMAALLSLEPAPSDAREFLQSLVNDYIILTR